MKLKKIISTAFLAVACMGVLNAETIYFGYSPTELPEDVVSLQGSGTNSPIEAMIRLSTTEMPQLAKIKGSKVVGVRCYLRNDYEQKSLRSGIRAYGGSLGNEVARKVLNLYQGWNEVKFDEPLTIGDEDLYVGFRVYENQGSLSHPIVAYRDASVSDTYYTNISDKGWTAGQGAVLMQAIIETSSPEVFDQASALVSVHDYPLVVAPNTPFDAKMYVKNMSTRPITSVTVDNGLGRVTVDATVDAFGTAEVAATFATGSEEGPDIPMTFGVVGINGEEATPAYVTRSSLFVTHDAFTRIPLIEEFTSQGCVNCPFMFYYLEGAREAFEHPHTYVAHHAGFTEDNFTTQVDRDLLYLFGTPSTSNPAVMYDRTLLPGETRIVHLAKSENTIDQYMTKLEAALRLPALARVDVKIDEEGEITVSGRVSIGDKTSDGNVYLSAYMVEDGITTDKYPQRGINQDMADDAPADLKEKFRHNGVIRAILTENTMGDKLEWDADGNYSVKFKAPKLVSECVKENCHVVAVVHRINLDNLADNYVLNSGDSRLDGTSGIAGPVDDNHRTRPEIVVTADRRILVVTPVRSISVYEIGGRRVDPSIPLAPGVYIVRAVMPDGTDAVLKVAVR